jgi:hypothetical protein
MKYEGIYLLAVSSESYCSHPIERLHVRNFVVGRVRKLLGSLQPLHCWNQMVYFY